MTDDAVVIQHNAEASRFEAHVDGGMARADYRMREGVMQIVHTEVPPALEGRGLAGKVVRSALDFAREGGMRVVPLCSYVRDYMRRHPETQSLLPEGAKI